MLIEVFLLFLLLIFSILTRHMLEGANRKKQKAFEKASIEYRLKNIECTHLGSNNAVLKTQLEETVLLYEITREICKFLDQDVFFKNFLEQARQYVKIKDARLLQDAPAGPEFLGYTIIPLLFHRAPPAYLAVKGLVESDREKFHILTQQFHLGLKRAMLYKRMQDLAITDTLTQVFTRKHYLDRLQEEIEYSKKLQYTFACLMLDVDHFKECNDHYGHLVGDAILKEVARVIRENLRQIDLVGRYGGEEFSIILTQTDKQGALFAAERIRHSLESQTVRVYDEDLKVSISVGISIFPEHASKLEELIDKADKALYKAKALGRNRVVLFEGAKS